MKVLITGGAGFIGSHLAEKFLSEGHEVKVLDITSNLENIQHLIGNPKFEFVQGDITNYETCKKVVEGCEYVCHLAALISVDHSIKEPKPFWETNVGGTFNILDASLNSGVKKFHYMSSCEMIGHIEHPDKATEERAVYFPRSPYAASKLAAETYCRAYQATYNFPIVITRAFNVYGPRQNPSERGAMIAKFITRMLRNEPPQIFGDGMQSRDWTFVKDVAEGIYLATMSNNSTGELFHIASEIDRKVIDVANLLIKTFGKNIQPAFINSRPGEMMRSCGDASKVKKILGWQQKVSFEEGIQKTIEYFKNKV